MSTVSGWLDCSWAVRPRGDCEWDAVVVVIPPSAGWPAGRSPTLLRERAHAPAPSQVCGQPSLPELLRSPWPWRDLQFSPFIYTPSPWLHITSEWCGRMAAADPGLGGCLRWSKPAPLEGRGPGHVTHSVTLWYATIQKECVAFYSCSNWWIWINCWFFFSMDHLKRYSLNFFFFTEKQHDFKLTVQ